jgi:hypothetical protein
MSEIKIDGSVSGGNVNAGGTQNFYGDVYFGGRPVEAAPPRNNRIFIDEMGNTDAAIEELERAIMILRRYNLSNDASSQSVEQLETRLARWRSEISS